MCLRSQPSLEFPYHGITTVDGAKLRRELLGARSEASSHLVTLSLL